jgi:hypothetical protein
LTPTYLQWIIVPRHARSGMQMAPVTKIHNLAEDSRIQELLDLNTKVHTISDLLIRRILEYNPESNNPKYHSFMLDNDQIIAGTSLIPHKMNWHGTEIRVGEIGMVGTLEEHRKQSHCTTLMNKAIDSMRSDNIPLSFLWGIPNFYEHFHYYYAFPNHSTPYVILPKMCIEGWQSTGMLRPSEPSDLWWIQKLYRAYNSELTGTISRSRELWEWIFKISTESGAGAWFVPEDPMGGYMLVAGKPPKVWEIAAPSENSLRNLVLGAFKAYPELDSLGFCHHPDMPIGKWLYRWGAKVQSVEDIWQGTWGGMVRILDPVTLLKTMAGKLNSRLENSRFYNYKGGVSIESEVGSVTIGIRNGNVDIQPFESGSPSIYIPASVLTPLLTGYRGFERYRCEFTDLGLEISDLLSVLFQRDKTFVYPLLYVDEFPTLKE